MSSVLSQAQVYQGQVYQGQIYDASLQARFARAARHSRWVRTLRVAVPATVILAMGIIVYVSFFNKFRVPLPNGGSLDPGDLAVSGTKITMVSPHLSGFTPDQRPYEVWAKTATQDITDPSRVELSTLRATLLMEDKSNLLMDARTGNFDNKKQLLELRDDIFLRTSTGYEARMNQALVDMGKGTVTSDEHVDVKLVNGTLSADRMRITDRGEVIRFEGHVVMLLDKLGDNAHASAPQEVPAESTLPAQTQAVQGKSDSR